MAKTGSLHASSDSSVTPAGLSGAPRRRGALPWVIAAGVVALVAGLVIPVVVLVGPSALEEFETASRDYRTGISGPDGLLNRIAADSHRGEQWPRQELKDAAEFHAAAAITYQNALHEIDFPDAARPHVTALITALEADRILMTNMQGAFSESEMARLYGLRPQLVPAIMQQEKAIRAALK